MAPKTHEGFLAEQHMVMSSVVTVVVVWANVGAGFETLKHFARMNPGLLVVACRNEGKGKEAVIRYELLWNTDLVNLGSVPVFDASLTGLMYWKGGISPFGRQWVLPRIAVVASDVHYWTMSAVESPITLALTTEEGSRQLVFSAVGERTSFEECTYRSFRKAVSRRESKKVLTQATKPSPVNDLGCVICTGCRWFYGRSNWELVNFNFSSPVTPTLRMRLARIESMMCCYDRRTYGTTQVVD
ncbi:hypothetical protein ARMGADRAFT_1120431 [Armillaria gallica]|uniref:Uncharacterized protein n=1 Tax=Armillaria gallica TaxID=47427 RepID=A0A2H3DJH4_ARMGA|nr:hypothetical protein ARMGADRAFT_1120431 [Armillaria gallica]